MSILKACGSAWNQDRRRCSCGSRRSNFELQAIIRNLDSGRKVLTGFGVLDVVRYVRQQCLAWFESANVFESLLQIHVCRMAFEPERIDYEQVEMHQPAAGFLGNQVAVGYIREAADPESADLQPSVDHRQCFHVRSEKIEQTLDPMRDDSGQAWILGRLKSVGVHALQAHPGGLGCVTRNRAGSEHERPGIVQAKTVIGVRVGEQNCVQLLEPNSEGLLSEIGGRINQDVVSAVLNQNRCAETLVSGVLRQTGRTLAAD